MTDTTRIGRPRHLRLRSADDLVSAVPYLTGFHPRDSLVVLGIGAPAGTFTARFDLPPVGAAGTLDGLVAHIADLLVHHAIPGAALVGYGPGERVTPLIEYARTALTRRGVRLVDALRVEGGRYWSYVCRDARCCPPEGRAFEVATSEIAAEATVAGWVALPGREELERAVAPVAGAERAAMRRATAGAERRLLGWIGDEDDPEAIRGRMADEGVAFVRAMIERAVAERGRGGGAAPSPDEIAWLGLLLTHLRVRDEAWTSIREEHLEAHLALWGALVRRVEDAYVAAPACLLAVAAWLGGQGALANVALDRAVRADRDYSMARLLREGMLCGLAPSDLRRVMRECSPAEAG